MKDKHIMKKAEVKDIIKKDEKFTYCNFDKDKHYKLWDHFTELRSTNLFEKSGFLCSNGR